jgi:hypothetical protein
MLASAVGPSSQGVGKTKWSFAEMAANPQSLAASTAPCSRGSERGSSPKRMSGKWTPNSTGNAAPGREIANAGKSGFGAKPQPDGVQASVTGRP